VTAPADRVQGGAAAAGGGVLVLNAGSSSIKFAVYAVAGPAAGAEPAPLLKGQVEGVGGKSRFRVFAADGACRLDAALAAPDHDAALKHLLGWLDGEGAIPALIGVGHRVVHGGTRFIAPVLITARLVDELAALAPLAPLHQPHNVAAIRAVTARRPGLRQVACFDTAFHATQPDVARQTGLPLRYWKQGIRRYGFHGLSYEAIVETFPAVAGRPLPDRLVVAHLGNGASMCAILKGKSVATTMGFSTVDGIPMGTRSGAIDPGALVHIAIKENLDAKGLLDLIYEGSGLKGMSGIGADMRTLLASDAPEAEEAIQFFCYRVTRELGSLAAALEGLDALVFTGGIGENAHHVREIVCAKAAWLGVALDGERNRKGGPMITRPGSRTPVWVIPAAEERAIVRHTCRVLAEAGPGPNKS
jgi:acetate kinase